MSLLRARWDEARIALALLTRLPTGALPAQLIPTGQCAWAFPFVGALVGAITGGVFCIAALVLPPLVAAFLAIGTGILLTGALHEDGLADVADGFGGGLTKDARLDIMRDSRIGTYGTLSLILVLALTATSIAALSSTGATLSLFAAIGAASRSAMLVPMAILPPARSDGLGQGASLSIGGVFWIGTGAGIMMLAIVQTALLLGILGATAACLMLAKRAIEGQTGDVLGATQKLAECAAWVLAAAYVSAS